jgi:F0F1-type ATP synthase assembly protein I
MIVLFVLGFTSSMYRLVRASDNKKDHHGGTTNYGKSDEYKEA